MHFKPSALKPLAAAALLAVAGVSQAAITVYTSQAAFNAATMARGTDMFTDLPAGSIPGPMTRSAGAYGYTATAEPAGAFYSAGVPSDPWLSTNTATDTVTFNTFVGGVVAAAGGNFFGSDINGDFSAADITLTATDAGGTTTFTLMGATTSSFVGFVSTGALTSMTMCVRFASLGRCWVPGDTYNGPFTWPTVDNLVLAQAVPEPATYGLLAAGLGVVGFVARRRRRS